MGIFPPPPIDPPSAGFGTAFLLPAGPEQVEDQTGRSERVDEKMISMLPFKTGGNESKK